MGFRFRRSIKIAPGVRINIGKRGVSSFGVGGFNFGKRSVYHNINIPGTGISYRSKVIERSHRKNASANPQKPEATAVSITLRLQDDGTTVFLDRNGNPLADEIVHVAKKQNKELIFNWLQEQRDKYNSQIESLLRIHLHTPAPIGEVVVNPKPEPPEIESYGLMSTLFDSHRQKIDEQNKQAQQAYENALVEWERAEHALATDTEVMSTVLSDAFTSIEWPRETLVSFEITDGGSTVFLDVDLPEVEDMPTQEAEVNKKDFKLVMKERSQSQLQLDYLTHIHAIGFRLIGGVFAHLPSVSTVVFSGYSQRPNRKTGNIENEYLYSVRVLRGAWQQINFDNLDAVDVVTCFGRFDLRRSVTKRGIISPVEPFEMLTARKAHDKELHCTKCGATNPPEYNFCGDCGTPLFKPSVTP